MKQPEIESFLISIKQKVPCMQTKLKGNLFYICISLMQIDDRKSLMTAV